VTKHRRLDMESLSQKRYRQKPEVKERMRVYRREWARKHRKSATSQKDVNLKQNYGITLAKFDKMFDAQNGKCAICGNVFESRDGRGVHVDHDHKTGTLRDLLCNHCNHMIGHAMENPEILSNAIAYLAKWKQAAGQQIAMEFAPLAERI
jgi:hypothetical protein